MVESYSYSAFGTPRLFGFSGTEILPPCSALGNPYGFAGQRWDAESALWYCRNRMYSPVLGRFLQRDPAGYVDGVNLYAYCRNNPLAFIDPWGLSAVGAQAGFGYVAAQTAIGFAQRWLQFQMAPINALSLIGEGALVAATDGSYQPRSPAFNSLVSGGVTAYTEGGQSAGDWYFRHQELGAVTGGVWTAGQAGYQIANGVLSGDIEQTGQGLVTGGTILGLGAFSLHMEAAVAAQAAGVATGTQAQALVQAESGGRLISLDANAFRNLQTVRESGAVAAGDNLVVTPNVAAELARRGVSAMDISQAGVTVASQSPVGVSVAATRIAGTLRDLGGRGAASASADALNLAESVGLGADTFITADRQILNAFGGSSTMPGTGGARLRVLGF